MHYPNTSIVRSRSVTCNPIIITLTTGLRFVVLNHDRNFHQSIAYTVVRGCVWTSNLNWGALHRIDWNWSEFLSCVYTVKTCLWRMVTYSKNHKILDYKRRVTMKNQSLLTDSINDPQRHHVNKWRVGAERNRDLLFTNEIRPGLVLYDDFSSTNNCKQRSEVANTDLGWRKRNVC